MIHPAESTLQDRFCPEITYKKNDNGSGNPCGFIVFGMRLPNKETIQVLADAIFYERPECRWFLITTAFSDCGFNDENYWPRIVVKEITINGWDRVRHILKYNTRKESHEDMKRMLDECDRSAIGITREQFQAGINFLTRYRAEKYLTTKKMEAKERYENVMKELSEIEKLIAHL